MNNDKLIWATFETPRAVARFAVVPATVDEQGRVMLKLYARDREDCAATLDRRDLLNVCSVLRGFEEFAKIGDRVTFRHVIEPRAGYCLAFHDGSHVVSSITFDHCDALALCIAFENAFSKIVFGI